MIPTSELRVTEHSTLELFPLEVKQDANEFVVGRPATGSYVVLSDGALAAARLLSSGRTIAEAKAALERDRAVQAPRLRPLLETLLAAGMVRSVEGVALAEPLPRRRYHLTFLQRRHVAWLFSWPAVAVYAALVGMGVSIACSQPRYLPRPADALVVTSPAGNLALLWGVSLLAMAAHEFAHLAAATFLGVQASFALSHRLFFAVAQTDLTDLWLVDRNKRYLAYAAGMANDVLLACAAVTVLWLHDRHVLAFSASLYGTLRLAILVWGFGVLWQFNFYLRTDVYYVIANATGCRNLSYDATAYLKSMLTRLFTGAAPEPLAGLSRRERRIVRGYAVLMALGTAGVVAVGAAYAGGLLVLLLGRHGPGAARHLSPQVAPAGLAPVLASLGVTCCWVAYAIASKRRKRPRVCYTLVAPEDL